MPQLMAHQVLLSKYEIPCSGQHDGFKAIFFPIIISYNSAIKYNETNTYFRN